MSEQNSTPTEGVTIGGFDVTKIKPYLESQSVKGAIEGVIGAVLGIVVGSGAAALATDVYGVILGAAGLVAGGVGLYGSIRALIGRFRAVNKIG